MERSEKYNFKKLPLKKAEKSVSLSGDFEFKMDENEKEKTIKQEAARMVRMEVWLDNANLTKLLCQTMVEKPNITAEEFYKIAANSGIVVHPEVTKQFIDQVIKVRQQVHSYVEQFNRTTNGKHTLEREVYKSLLAKTPNSLAKLRGYIKGPTKEIRVDDQYPLALVFWMTSASDFDLIGDSNIVGGYYCEVYPTSLPAESGNGLFTEYVKFEFPIIVINGSDYVRDPNKTMLHEQGHAEQSNYLKALRQEKRKLIWQDHEKPPINSAKKLVMVKGHSEEIKSTMEWKIIIEYALSKAKDELLAELKSTQSLSKIHHHLMDYNYYDYFATDIKIEFASPLHIMLWQEYRVKLSEASRAAHEIITAYARWGLRERIDTFRWVLAQIPLSNWARQLKATLFLKEASLLNEVFNRTNIIKNDDNYSYYYDTINDIVKNQNGMIYPQLVKLALALDIKVNE